MILIPEIWPLFLDGLDNKCVEVNKETVITVDASQAGDGKVTCRIRSPSGNDIDIEIVENDDGTFSLLFTPQVTGAYTINIKFGGETVPGGEYDIQVSSRIFNYFGFILWFVVWSFSV